MTRTKVETVFSINSLISRPLNPWTDIKPDWPEYDCVAAQGLEIQTNFCLSTHHNRHESDVTFRNGSKYVAVRFSQLGNARMWEQYANCCKDANLGHADADSLAEIC